MISSTVGEEKAALIVVRCGESENAGSLAFGNSENLF